MIQFDRIVGSALKAKNENPMSISEALSEVSISPILIAAAVSLGLILSAFVAL